MYREVIKTQSEKIELVIPSDLINVELEVIINPLIAKKTKYGFKRAQELSTGIKGNLSETIIEERNQ